MCLLPNVAEKQIHQCRSTFINLTHACCVATSHLTVLSIPTQWNWLEPLYLFIFGCENLCPVLKSSSGYTNHINYQAKTKDHGNKTANDRRPRSSSPQVLLAINMVELKMSMPSGQDAALRGHFLIFFSPCFHASSGTGKASHRYQQKDSLRGKMVQIKEAKCL